jgi:Protein of unknown function (DUF2800)
MEALMSDEYHALASPSKSAMFLACANSLAMNEGQPEGDRKAADLGSDKHELLTLCLQFNADAMSYDGHVLKLGHTVNKELAADVQTVVDNVRDRIRVYELRGFLVTVELEQDLPIEHITGEAGATGRGDIVLIVSCPDGSSFADVIDAKFGWQEVDAECNPQLLMYGSGGLVKFGLTEEFTEVNLVIEQPARGVSDEWSTTPEAIEAWVVENRPKAEKAIMIHRMRGERALKEEDFAPSEKACQWCKAKAICPALLAKVEAIAETDFDTVEPVPVEAVSVEKLGAIFPELEMIEDWIKAVRARIELEVFAGRTVPGVKVVAGKRANRAWSSDEEAEALMKKFKMKQEAMYSFKLLGPKPILEALKDQPRRLKQIEQLIVQPDGKPHVVHESDKRPAIEIKPVEDGFETVEEDLC